MAVLVPGGIDQYTKVLLHGDGADEATTTEDASDYGLGVTMQNGAKLDDAYQKFGPTSLYGGGSPEQIAIANHADQHLSGQDFMIDFWIKWSAWGGVFSKDLDTSNFITLVKYSTTWLFEIEAGGSTIFNWSANQTLNLNQEYHVAAVKAGSTFRLFVNATKVTPATSETLSGTWSDFGGAISLFFGRDSGGASTNFMSGWIDEFRWSVGSARGWSTDGPHTVPTERYRRILQGPFFHAA